MVVVPVIGLLHLQTKVVTELPTVAPRPRAMSLPVTVRVRLSITIHNHALWITSDKQRNVASLSTGVILGLADQHLHSVRLVDVIAANGCKFLERTDTVVEHGNSTHARR